MPWTVYGIFIIFALFVLLMIINPRMSCLGRKVSSPFYPLLKKRKKKAIKTEDYGFHLVNPKDRPKKPEGGDREEEPFSAQVEAKKPGKVIKTYDYGFHLGEKKEDKEKNRERREEVC